MAPSHVLIPLDGSPLSDEALSHALETYNCAITVLTVRRAIDAGMSEGAILDPGETGSEAALDYAGNVIDAATDRADADGRSIETVVESGDPAEEILEFVEDTDVDHIVMGAHGGDRGHLAQRLLGPVSTVVVAEAPVSVTVVRDGVN